MKTKKSIGTLLLLVMVGGCTDPTPEPKPQLIKQTNLKAEPLLGQMVSSLRNEAKSSRNPDGEEDVFDQVNWNDVSRYKDEEQSLYTATFLQDEENFTDNLVVGGTADEPFAYIVRYKPEEGEFDGKISTFTGTIEMYTLEGERFAREKLRNGESQSHLRGEAAWHHRRCIIISYQIFESCSKRPGDYCTIITLKRIRICGRRRFEDSRKIYRRNNTPKQHRRRGSKYGNYERPPCIDLRSLLMNRHFHRSRSRISRPCFPFVLIPRRRWRPRRPKKPCRGNPLPTMKVARQKNSGIKGGMFGCTRYSTRGCTDGGKNYPGRKKHEGIDLENPYGAPVYAMYDGKASKRTQYDRTGKVSGAGHYVNITSTVNGKKITIGYFHLQNGRRASGNVKAGDIIGYQGTSGNLKGAIERKETVSHVHIKVKDKNNNAIDPRPYIKTKIRDNGSVETKGKSNCN